MSAGGDTRLLSVGAVVAALGASLCCILPVAVAVLGMREEAVSNSTPT